MYHVDMDGTLRQVLLDGVLEKGCPAWRCCPATFKSMTSSRLVLWPYPGKVLAEHLQVDSQDGNHFFTNQEYWLRSSPWTHCLTHLRTREEQCQKMVGTSLDTFVGRFVGAFVWGVLERLKAGKVNIRGHPRGHSCGR